MRLLSAISVLAVSTSIAACSMAPAGSAPTLAAATAAATAPPTPSAGPQTTQPTVEPTPGQARLISAGIDSDPLASGRWRTQNFLTPIEFDVEDGEWLALLDTEHYTFLRRVPDQPNGVGIASLQNVFLDPCSDGSSGDVVHWEASSGPAEFFDWLAEQSPVDWGEPEPTTIAGHDALSIERLVPEDAFEECLEGFFPMIDVGVEPPGQLAIPRPGQRFSLSAVDLGSQTVVIVDFAYDGEPYENHHGAVNALLESMTFDDA